MPFRRSLKLLEELLVFVGHPGRLGEVGRNGLCIGSRYLRLCKVLRGWCFAGQHLVALPELGLIESR